LQGTGESLLNPRFEQIFDAAAADESRRLDLITNASLLNRELIHRFIKSNMQLVISLDGSDKIEFTLQRPIGNFDAIMNNLYIIQAARGNAVKSFSCVINMVCTRLTCNSVHKMIDLAVEIGIDFLFVSEVRPCMPDEEWEKLRLDNIEDRSAFDAYIANCTHYAAAKNIGFNFNAYSENKAIKKKVCAAPWRHIYLYSNGDISSCCELDRKYGNLQKEHFNSIWNGEVLNIFRSNMLMGKFEPRCLNCCLPWGLTHE
jgi:MoaA/NifB/PqqE/SkfB family radical SAM enzyme